MKFAFLIHPITSDTQSLFQIDDGGQFRKLWKQASVLEISDYLQSWFAATSNPNRGPGQVRVIDEFTDLYSVNGTVTEGRLYEIPMTATEIKDDPNTAIAHIQRAIEMAQEWGAKIVGLGSMTGVVGGQGAYVAERTSLAVTTGNSLTVYAALENLREACRQLEMDPSQETVAVIGVPGSIASAVARMLAPSVRELILVARQDNLRGRKLAESLDAELLTDIPAAAARAQIIISATSTGACINQADLRRGAVVLDVGVPADVRGRSLERNDVLVISAGLTGVPATMSRDSHVLGFYFGVIPGCLGETINLALEERCENYSLGRDLEPARIREIGQIARRNGFDFSHILSFGQPVADATWANVMKVHAQRRFRASRGPAGHHANGTNGTVHPRATAASERIQSLLRQDRTRLPEIDELATRAETRFARYINPVLAGLGREAGIGATFVRGEGCYLWDEKGRKYLDFVAGFGSVNLGHNHPRVVAAVQEALTRQAPGFIPSGINPYTAALAEKLVSLTPEGLEMVFYCNSGTEAVEAALKLARLASGRPGFLSCDGSYHGKTFGSLSVTSNISYQKPFSPLLPGCESVPYGNAAALREALATRRYGAFIVEPVQGEGGMHLPPADYLQAAERLCRESKTLFIVDEVQTGFGRTGSLFASTAANVRPDLMCLAKSLGGGMMPIGAMLCRGELWREAYGSINTFALHTSTFGGGSLACVAGLAAVNTLVEEDLARNASERGKQLLEGLLQIQADVPEYIREVRGQGLMMGVELTPLTPIVAKHLKRADLMGLLQYLGNSLDDITRNLPAIFQMQMLLKYHGIYAQMTRSHPLVLRVQPPLTITEQQADAFLAAFRKTCTAGQRVENMFDAIISHAIAGDHSKPGRGEAVACNGASSVIP